MNLIRLENLISNFACIIEIKAWSDFDIDSLPITVVKVVSDTR